MSKRKSDITAKIFALVIAIILWSYVMDKANPVIPWEYKNVTVSLSNISALDQQNLVIMEPQQVTVKVNVSGTKNDMSKFSAKNIVAQVDLSGYSEGQVKIPVTVALIDQVSGIKVTNYEPKEILFTFDKLITIEKPVTIETIGNLPENYVPGDISTKSEMIQIKGPRTWVNKVSKVIAIVNLKDRKTTDLAKVPIKVVNDAGDDVRGVEIEPKLIDINIPVLRKVSLPIELQTVNELPDNFVITDIVISPTNIEVVGSNDIVNLTKIVTKPIDVNTLLDKKAVEVELDLPEGVELLNPKERVTIFYNIEETTIKDYTFTPNEIKAINLDESLILQESDFNTEILVSLKGISSMLDGIDKEDLAIHVDLIDLKEGRHDVDITIDEIQGVTVEKINPKQLTINLNKR